MGALPVAAFTFFVIQWSIASGRLERPSDDKNFKHLMRKQSRAAKAEAKQARIDKKDGIKKDKKDKKLIFHKRAGGDLFYGKAMTFGGGFYGTMALLTYILIEIAEIWQFLGVVFSPSEWENKLGIGLLIEFFINSIMNLVAAFIWFITLPNRIDMENGWIWLGAAYLGYEVGTRVANHYGDEIWQKMSEFLAQRGAKIRGRSEEDPKA